jgi:hypothetical protein
VLGILVLLVSVGFGQPADAPFRFAAALVVGPAAFSDAFPIAVAVPTFFGYLVDRLTITAQLWNGILPYVFVYGPLLGLYVAWRRPGVIDDWQAVGPPAGVFVAPTSVSPAPPDSAPDTGRQG